MRIPDYEPRWIAPMLRAAGVYNLVWGLGVIAFPLALFRWTGMEDPRYPWIWQCVGMIVGVYGIGYWIAAANPFRHWPIVLVGLLGKVLGPIGFVWGAIHGQVPWIWGITIVTNDLIWWWPFATVLYLAFRSHSDASRLGAELDLDQAIRTMVSHRGATLYRLSQAAPTMVVFLRHSGCTFCREALQDLSDLQAGTASEKLNLAVVHMSSPLQATLTMQKYGLEAIQRFSDPHCVLYRAFGLERGRFGQLFSPTILWRGLVGLWKGYGLGAIHGDGFRLPGVFVLDRGRLTLSFRARHAADRPDYRALAAQAIGTSMHTPGDQDLPRSKAGV